MRVTGGPTGDRQDARQVMNLCPCASTVVSVQWDQATSQAMCVRSRAYVPAAQGKMLKLLAPGSALWALRLFTQEAGPDSCSQRSLWMLSGEGSTRGFRSKLLMVTLQKLTHKTQHTWPQEKQPKKWLWGGKSGGCENKREVGKKNEQKLILLKVAMTPTMVYGKDR